MLIRYLNIDPHELDEVQSFDWMVRTIAQGNYHGKKLSRKLGAGMEFSQYRPYSQGDDLRRLDWKMYARTDRYYIKESEIETQVEITFVLDTSRSMTYAEEDRSKLQFGQLLTAILSYLAMQEGDAVGLATAGLHLSGQQEREWRRYLHELLQLPIQQHFEAPKIHRKRAKELFVVLTDHYDETGEIRQFVSDLRTRHSEVVVLHLLGAKESRLDFEQGTRLEDLESGQIVTMDPATMTSYQKRIATWQDELRQEYLKQGIDYLMVDFTTPFSAVIQLIQQHRKRLA